MSACTFFGHRECYGLDREVLYRAIKKLILQGADTFYVGNQGQFDTMAYGCLRELRVEYPYIHVSMVLAYFPGKKEKDLEDTVYPEEIEVGPRKFAIERRNRWLIDHSEHCLCYVGHSWGGAYKFAQLAKHRGKNVINLCDLGPEL